MWCYMYRSFKHSNWWRHNLIQTYNVLVRKQRKQRLQFSQFEQFGDACVLSCRLLIWLTGGDACVVLVEQISYDTWLYLRNAVLATSYLTGFLCVSRQVRRKRAIFRCCNDGFMIAVHSRFYRKSVVYGSSKSGLHIGRHCRKCVEYRCTVFEVGANIVLLS